jgi:hypothetical protein
MQRSSAAREVLASGLAGTPARCGLHRADERLWVDDRISGGETYWLRRHSSNGQPRCEFEISPLIKNNPRIKRKCF